MFSLVELSKRGLLILIDRVYTLTTYAYRELMAQGRQVRPVIAAVITDGGTALATMMLSLAHHLLLPHGLIVPEERSLTVLAFVLLYPVRVGGSLCKHVPDNDF